MNVIYDLVQMNENLVIEEEMDFLIKVEVNQDENQKANNKVNNVLDMVKENDKKVEDYDEVVKHLYRMVLYNNI